MDKERKKALKNAAKNATRGKIHESLPVNIAIFKQLFSYLNSNLSSCDHTLKETEKFFHAKNIDPQKVIPFLNEHGGYCDCEVSNVEDIIEDLEKHA